MTRQQYICDECESVFARDEDPEMCPSCRSDWTGNAFEGFDAFVDEAEVERPKFWSPTTKLVLGLCLAVTALPGLLQGVPYAIGSAIGTTAMVWGARYLQIGRRVSKRKRKLARKRALEQM